MNKSCALGFGLLRGWAVSVAVALAPFAVGAVTMASASVSELKFTLIDLDPGRPSAPSLSWAANFTSVEATRSFGELIDFLPQPDGSLQWSVSFADTVGQRRERASGALQVLTAGVQGASASTGAAALGASIDTNSGKASLFGFGFASGDLVLSAKTELRITANLSTLVSGPSSMGFVSPAGVSPDVGVGFSQAYAYAELFLDGTSALASVNGISYAPNANAASFPMDAYADGLDKPVELIFRNDLATDASASFYVLVQASGSEITLAVPEPSQWVLLAAGLALIGAAARRRSAA